MFCWRQVGEGGYGGAVSFEGPGSLNLINSSLVDNKADFHGGALYINRANATLTNTSIAGNKVLCSLLHVQPPAMNFCSPGAALSVRLGCLVNSLLATMACRLQLQHCWKWYVSSCCSACCVCGFFLQWSPVAVWKDRADQQGYCSVQAGRFGGGILCSSASCTLLSCAIVNNTAVATGGGVHTEAAASFSASNCTVHGNKVGWGGYVRRKADSSRIMR